MTTHVALAGLSFSSMSGRLLLVAVLLAVVGLLLLKRARDARADEAPADEVHHHAAEEATPDTEPRSLRSRFARSTPVAAAAPAPEAAPVAWQEPPAPTRHSFGDRIRASRAAFAEPGLVLSADEVQDNLFAAPVPPPVAAAALVAVAAPVAAAALVAAAAPVAPPAAPAPAVAEAPVEAPVPAMAGAPLQASVATEAVSAAPVQAPPQEVAAPAAPPQAPRPATPERPPGLFAPVPPGSQAAGGRAPGATVVPKL
jgi:cytoskeletal protein RodZ